MRCFALLVFLAAALQGGQSLLASEQVPLRLLYLGNDPVRTSSFEEFLATHFDSIVVRNHSDVTKDDMRKADVVLLDWSQREAYRSLSSPSDRSDPFAVSGDVPLGDRESWSKPTVLLGSAGHLLAGFWEVAGGSG